MDADENVSGSAGSSMAKAEALAKTIRKARPQPQPKSSSSSKPASPEGGGAGGDDDDGFSSWEGLAPPTEAEVTNVLLQMGSTWPTQQVSQGPVHR